MQQHVKEFIDGYTKSVVWTAYIFDDEGEVWHIEDHPYITDDDLEDVTHRIKTDPGVIQDWLMDNDTSNPFAELANQTPDATVMVPLIGEDDAEWGDDRKASQLLSVLGTTDESYYNKARDLIANAPTDLGMAYIVTKVCVSDLVESSRPGDTVTVNNPTVVYGNPFTGGVHAEDFTGLRFTAPIESILPDGAWGYPVEEVWGGFPGDNEEPAVWANNRPTTPAPVQGHLDTLYDYTLAITR